ncbi:MAG: hypothetical protein KGJ68_02095 [Gammaproteobacteria bacterium]|nr:hypothetical protein [Gammaproteobacteria bacterium]
MIRVCLAFLALAACAGPALADEPPSACANALEQVAALETALPVYKLVPPDSRLYLEDTQRPAELARVRQLVSSSCSADAAVRAAAEAEARRLHQGRSPECAFERDRLAEMEKADSRNDRDDIARQRQRVANRCPAVPMANVWLVAERPIPQ